MARWRATALVLVAVLLASAHARAQALTGTVIARVTEPGTDAEPITVSLTPRDHEGRARTVVLPAGRAETAIPVPVGAYGLRVSRPGFHTADTGLDLSPNLVVVIEVRLAPASGGPPSAPGVVDRYTTAYQTGFDATKIDVLPSTRTAWSLLETAHPFLIVDRIDGGGIWTGEASLAGGQGTSGFQTTILLDGVDVTDPLRTGTPMLYPDLGGAHALVVESASVSPAAPGPGPVISLVPPRAGRSWSGAGRAATAPGGLQSEGGDIPPIARLETWTDAGISAGGPAGGAGLFTAARFTNAGRTERANPARLDDIARSLFVNLTARPRPDDEVRLQAAAAAITRPLASRVRFADRDLDQEDRSLVLHAAWARQRAGASWSIGGGYQRAGTAANVPAAAAGGTVERLRDGPPLNLVDTGDSTRDRWTVQGDAALAPRRWLGRDHDLRAGVTFAGARALLRHGPQPRFAEVVNGRPARVWDVAFAAPESRWSSTSLSAFASDRVSLSDRVTLLAAVRLELDRGSADGAASSIHWTNLSPRVTARWRPGLDVPLAITTGYAWYRHRLPLDYFSVGDPAGLTGVMYRWDDVNGDGGLTVPTELTAVAAVGGCCAGGQPNTIDPGLARPTTREFRIGVEHEVKGWRWAITGLDRREDNGVAVLNTGVTARDYTVTFVEDPGVDVEGRSGFEPLPIFNRRPDSFLRDRLVLSNAPTDPSRYQGVEITLDREAGPRWFFRFGGTAYRSEGVGAHRGYRPDENDQGLLGEVFVTPNAATNARGRLFFDRAYVMKVMAAYTAPGPFRAAFVARYQDGQPFSRLLVVDGLSQGTGIVQAYPRGGQRFTYTATLDARVEWRWPFGAGRSVGLTLDAFNLLDMANEVEEDIVTGLRFRTITAVQPPRVVHVGLRVLF